MGSLGEAVVEVRADLAPLSAGLGKAEGMVSGFVGSTGNAILSGVTTALATKGIESVAATGHALFNAAVAAADLGETFSKVRTTFGSDARKVEDFADEMADKFGLVRREVLDASAGIGLIGQGAGLSASRSAALSVSMARLAADASSFYNVPLPVALEKIRAGLVGESEPLRAFGVLLSEDAVKAEAFRSGLAKAGDELDEQQKVMARAAIITRQLATASGDLERTQDSASNQMRKFTGDLENFKADVGKSFIGPLTEAMKLAREFGAVLAKVGGDKPTDAAGAWATSWIRAIRTVGAAWDPAKFQIVLKAAARGENGLQALADDMEGINRDKRTAPDARNEDFRLPAAQRPKPMVDAFGRDVAGARARQEDGAKLRKQTDANDRREALRGVGELARGFAQKALGVLSSGAALASGDRTRAPAAQAQIQGAAGALGPLSGAGARLLVGGMRAVGAMKEGVREGAARRDAVGPSRIMGAEDYGSLALTAPMNGAKEKALAEAEKANDLLGRGNDLLGKIFETLNRAGGGGGGRAVLRGRA